MACEKVGEPTGAVYDQEWLDSILEELKAIYCRE